jgi:hypothetical protein
MATYGGNLVADQPSRSDDLPKTKSERFAGNPGVASPQNICITVRYFYVGYAQTRQTGGIAELDLT